MQKLRITNTYNRENNQYEKGTFDIRESEKSITGKVNISTKKDNKYISKTLPFIAFKSKIDRETERAILDSRGQLFDAEIGLMVDNFQDQTGKTITYVKVVINQARFEAVDKHNQAKANGYQPEDLLDDDIPF
jgi:hypothetical protein|tara:strand:- start:598 stop:996 length:399 start_codon:yes stop_codon:yes gene_type:complete